MSTKKNILFNSVATLFQKGVRILDQLLLVPFFLHAWGSEYYGEWLTLTIIPSILAFSDLGFGSAAANSFVLAYTSGNKQKASNIAKTGLIVITGAVLLATVIAVLSMFIAKEQGLFDKSHIDGIEALQAVSLMIAARVLSFYMQLFEAFYRAGNKAAKGIFYGSLHSLLNVLAGITVLMAGAGIVGYALTICIISFIYNILYAYIGTCQISIPKGLWKKVEAQSIFQKGLGYLMTPIWQSIFFQGTTFVVRVTLGAESVAIFNTLRTASRSVNQLYSMVNSSVFPELQILIGKNNIEKAQKVFKRSIHVILILALGGSLFLSLFGLTIYNWWTDGKLIVSQAIWLLFVLEVFINSLWWTAGMIPRAVNKPYYLSIAGVICSLLSILTSYILCPTMGILGAAIGCIVMEALMAMYMLPSSCKLINMPISYLISTTNNKKILL